ncbi:hypothetical protein ABL78_7270 [Leptomonas seymouri]|uniref:Uncharacterized protein n=1 Tax=Leptomonas seymouri TaxID=5684 RepID=A0A0N1I0V6_LEPSE|nr:hypothetical protein ABL78_7270 [Leptomonas seymouri]|eukprot:KPI83688.1 hypothetical protein ABL78_7270 [Leptomonas seymouri]
MHGVGDITNALYEDRGERTVAVAGDKHTTTTAVGGALTPCRLLNSSSSSFFSLANASGFYSRNGESSPAVRLFSRSLEVDRRSGGPQSQEVTTTSSKSSRLRRRQTPPLSNGLGFTTIHTRGWQRHCLQRSASPPHPTAATAAGGGSAPAGTQRPLLMSADGIVYVSSPMREAGYVREGLVTSFSRPPPRLASRFPPTNGCAHKNESDAEGDQGCDESSPAGAVPVSKCLRPASSHHANDMPVAAVHVPSTSLKEGGLRPEGAPPHIHSGEGPLNNGNGLAQAVTGFATPVSGRTRGAGLASALDVDGVRSSNDTQSNSSPSQATLHGYHRYGEAGGEATAADRTPPFSRTGAQMPSPVQPALTCTSLTAMDCTRRAGRRRSSARLKADHMSRSADHRLLRRTSVSASPFASARRHPAVREQHCSTSVAGFIEGRRTLISGLADGSRCPEQAPTRPTSTALDGQPWSPVSHATGPQCQSRHSIHFIYTRSYSARTVASPAQPTAATLGGRDVSSLSTVVGVAPAAKAQHNKVEGTTPWPAKQHETRRPTATLPFARSATFAGVSGERKPAVILSEEARASQARRSLARSEALSTSSGRGSRGSATDFDIAPQSYLMRWRQSQEEKARDATTAVRAIPTGAPSTTTKSSGEAPIATGTVRDSAPPPLSTSSATNSRKISKEEDEPAAPGVAPLPSCKAKAESPENSAAASASANGVSLAFRLACSLDEAPRSSSQTGTATTLSEAAVTGQSGAAPVPALLPVAAAPTVLNSATTTNNATPSEEAKPSAAAPCGTLENVTRFSVSLHHVAASDSTCCAAPSAVGNVSSASPAHSRGPARNASPAPSGVHQMEDYAHCGLVNEDIPEDQVPDAASRTASLEKAKSRELGRTLISPRRPDKVDPDNTRIAVHPRAEAPAVSTLVRASGHTPTSGGVSSRRSTAAFPSAPDKRGESDKDNLGEGTDSTGDVRELWRSVLERREQRLQNQREQQQESARCASSGQEAPQLRISTALPPPSTSLPPSPQPPRLSSSSLTGSVVSEALEAQRRSFKLESTGSRRTVASTPSPNPLRKVRVADSTMPDACSPSSVPGVEQSDAEADARCTNTLPASRAVTPVAGLAPSRLSSLTTAAAPTAHQKSTPPPVSSAPSSVVSSTSTARDGRTTAVTAGATTDTEATDEEQRRSRISQVLARCSVTASRGSRGIEGTSAPTTDESLAPVIQPGSEKKELALRNADHTSPANDSIAPPARSKGKSPAHCSAITDACAAPQPAFKTTAATQSSSPAADIEREARAEEQQTSAEACCPPTVAPHNGRPQKAVAEESMPGEAKTSAAATAAPAPADTPAVKHPAPATPPTTSPVEAKTAAAPLCYHETTLAPATVTAADALPVGHATPAEASAAPVAALWEVTVDELDKLEQSVNALLKNYGKNAAVVHTPPAGGQAAGKMTAADALLRQMPHHVQTTAEKKKAATNAGLARHSTPPATLAMEMSISLRHHAYDSEWDDEDSLWDASVMWCGEESYADERPPPTHVPPLDLTALHLPTGDYGDLKPYRIPLPTAVPAPEENRRHLLQLAGMLPCSPGSPGSNDRDDSGASNSKMGGRGTEAFTDAGSPTSSYLSSSYASMKGVSPLLGERIRCMKKQLPRPFAARVVFRATAASMDGEAGRRDSSSAQPSEASEEEAETDAAESSINEIVDEAPQPISRVTRFTDESDALDGGRGAARDIRIGQQKNRVRMVLLDCEEQRTRKELQAEEQTVFTALGKSYSRSSRMRRAA